MNEEAAKKQVARAFGEIFTIQGNWVFQGNVMNATEPAATVALPEETSTLTP